MAETGRDEAAQIPPGGHELSREFVVAHQRRRLTDAIARLCVERGFGRTSVSDIVRQARVSRTTFYANFDGKDDCFLAACDVACQEVSELAASARGDSWPERVRSALANVLEYVSQHPDYAYLCLVEALAAGDEARSRYEGTILRFARWLSAGRRENGSAAGLPATVEETLVGGVVWMIQQRLLKGDGSTVVELLPELVEFVLAPYIGPERAREVAGGVRAQEPLT